MKPGKVYRCVVGLALAALWLALLAGCEALPNGGIRPACNCDIDCGAHYCGGISDHQDHGK